MLMHVFYLGLMFGSTCFSSRGGQYEAIRPLGPWPGPEDLFWIRPGKTACTVFLPAAEHCEGTSVGKQWGQQVNSEIQSKCAPKSIGAARTNDVNLLGSPAILAMGKAPVHSNDCVMHGL